MLAFLAFDRTERRDVLIGSTRETNKVVGPFLPSTRGWSEGLPGSDYPQIDRSALVNKISTLVGRWLLQPLVILVKHLWQTWCIIIGRNKDKMSTLFPLLL